MNHKKLRPRAAQQYRAKPVLRANFVAAQLAMLPRQTRRARRLFLLLYYAVSAQCLAAAGVLNYCLITGYGENMKYHALGALLISMGVSIVCSRQFEKKQLAAQQRLLFETAFRKVE
jgi:hypothetical protein